MILTEDFTLFQHSKTHEADSVVERVTYLHQVARDGIVVSSKPHTVTIDRSNLTQEHPMPDGTVKTTAEIVAEIDG